MKVMKYFAVASLALFAACNNEENLVVPEGANQPVDVMMSVAGLYASRGENPLPVYKKAYEQFPGDIVAVLNYANALLKYGKDADGALQVLEVVREDSRVLFPMAIAYDMKGDWRKAEKLLEEAAARGCNRAKAFKAVRVNE